MLHELPVLGEADEHSSTDGGAQQADVWRSLEHRENGAAYQRLVEGEFMEGATEEEDVSEGTSRRNFMKIMGASMALAGLTACRKPVEEILPYTKMPEEVVPGESVYYATAMPLSGHLRGILVESHEGRPTKVEGNPEHPGNAGSGTGVYEQASLLNLYDPDRSQHVYREGELSTWKDFAAFAKSFSQKASGKRVAVLAGPSSSPTQQAVRRRLEQQYEHVEWVTYDAQDEEAQLLGAQIAFGQPLRSHYKFAEAGVVLSLDADFLGPAALNHPSNTSSFAEGRRIYSEDEKMNRLYAVESMHTVTGGTADHRLGLRSSEIPAFAAALAAELGVEEAAEAGEAFADHPWIEVVADDLREHAGSGIVLAGDTQPPAVHALCALINQALGNIGETVELLDTGVDEIEPQSKRLQALVDAMNGGAIDALVMLETNPVYNLPSELQFEQALGNVPVSIHLGMWQDETADHATWHLPQSHYLESWADGRSYNGVLSVVQPLIAPLYETRSGLEVLSLLADGKEVEGYELVRSHWQEEIVSDGFEENWRKVLHDGFLPGSEYSAVTPSAGQPIGDALGAIEAPGADELELVFRADPHLYDGRFANNAWMQEQPDPVTKITWDNVAVVSPATAEELGLSRELHEGKYFVDVVELSYKGSSLELPVWIVPGHADHSITVSLGYGREITSERETEGKPLIGVDTDIYRAGPLANEVGQNTYQLRTLNSLKVARGVSVQKTGSNYMIATTQDHGSLEGRDIVRWADLEEYKEEPSFAQEAGMETPTDEPWNEYPTLWEEDHPSDQEEVNESLYAEYQWGMVIDLNTCTGCGTCITACTSENNIPVVGKEQVSRGREMSWIRLDRYYTGDPENPGMVMQAMLCMHCENAPCEQVCPVAATSHSPDGINEMTYNRCIGTRYCANNCPWKVRRFNFFNWGDTLPEQVQMGMNPNVTVRFRGVMEKCTYCVQRIREVGQEARNDGRKIRDGELQTACQQACPAQAITFGDVSDPTTAVSKLKANSRNYETLAELGTRPRTSYLARVDNPNPRLAEV